MYPEIMPLYGPFSINSYGFMIVVGIIVFSYFFLRDSRTKNIITQDQYWRGLMIAIIWGVLGGRILFLLSSDQPFNFYSLITFWEGGLSLLGSVVILGIALPFYLYKQKLPIIPLLDVAATYAPLLQSISRIGCFLAGCCFGKPSTHFWSMVFPHIPFCEHIPLHPTQLYSSFLLFLIFLIMYFLVKDQIKMPGMASLIYLFLMAAERFFVDYWRADREYISLTQFFSLMQLIALGIMIIATVGIVLILLWHQKRK